MSKGKLSDNQVRILTYLAGLPSGRTTSHIFYSLCVQPRVVRALFAGGYVIGDDIPARYVGITPAGRAALPTHETIQRDT